MGKIKNVEAANDSGNTRLVIIIVVLVVLVIGSWLVYKNHQNNTSKTKATATVAQEIATTYTGWKTYTSYGVSIQYPSSWTLKNSSTATTISSATDSKTKLQFVITFYQYSSNPTNPVNDTVFSSLPLGIFGKKPIYMLMLDSKNSLGSNITGLYVSDTNSKSGNLANENGGFVDSKNVQYVLYASLVTASNGKNTPKQLTEYINNSNYVTVINILRSVKE